MLLLCCVLESFFGSKESNWRCQLKKENLGRGYYEELVSPTTTVAVDDTQRMKGIAKTSILKKEKKSMMRSLLIADRFAWDSISLVEVRPRIYLVG